MTFQELCNGIEQIAPLEYAYEWDSSGPTLYLHDEIENILVCLDVTKAVVEEAIKKGIDTIVSHHPLLFAPLASLQKDHYVDDVLIAAVQHKMNIYAAHTSYDVAPNGMNMALANLLELQNNRYLAVEVEENGIVYAAAGVKGELTKPFKKEAFARYVGEKLSLNALRITGEKEEIKTVACIGGAGADFILEAQAIGADAFITGEVKHHQFIQTENILLIEAGHYDTEKHFVAEMQKSLQMYVHQLQYRTKVFRAEQEKRPYEDVFLS
ncbi:MAG: Nif3-like dinuclear metal center hexameric protein [Christensenellaceae bacterium]|jgi:dinuclear metal center YbgI/SA1388 family protein